MEQQGKKSYYAPKVYLEAIEEMAEKGMVPTSELAKRWGMGRDKAASLLRRKDGPRGFWHIQSKKWFFTDDTQKPPPAVPGRVAKECVNPRFRPEGRGVGRGKYDRSKKNADGTYGEKRARVVLVKAPRYYRGDSVKPGSEQVPLETSWAVWKPTDAFVIWGGQRYRVAGKESFGWLGG